MNVLSHRRVPALLGLLLVALLAVFATALAGSAGLARLGGSPLTAAIVLGMIVGNTVYPRLPAGWRPGVAFAQQRLLRLGVMLYGLRITLQQMAEVGAPGLVMAVSIVASVFLLGTFFGTRVLGLDRDTAMLTSAGSAVCGAAAVLATEPVLRSEPHKSTVAVATVVLFGTVSMFLYPALFHLSGLDARTFGVYTGATVHEVAQVVAAGKAAGGAVADVAVIVKLTRVMLLAPFLMILGAFVARTGAGRGRATVPWFAVGFVVASAVGSTHLLPPDWVAGLVRVDGWLLTLAMAALGLETNLARLRGVGLRPVVLAFVLFVYLVGAGYLLTRAVTAVVG